MFGEWKSPRNGSNNQHNSCRIIAKSAAFPVHNINASQNFSIVNENFKGSIRDMLMLVRNFDFQRTNETWISS